MHNKEIDVRIVLRGPSHFQVSPISLKQGFQMRYWVCPVDFCFLILIYMSCTAKALFATPSMCTGTFKMPVSWPWIILLSWGVLLSHGKLNRNALFGMVWKRFRWYLWFTNQIQNHSCILINKASRQDSKRTFIFDKHLFTTQSLCSSIVRFSSKTTIIIFSIISATNQSIVLSCSTYIGKVHIIMHVVYFSAG